MKRIQKFVTAAILIILLPFVLVSGQEKKSEQRIKIVVKENGGSDVVLDTLITGTPSSDSIVMKNGKTIFLAREGDDIAPGASGTRKYVITTTSDGEGSKENVNKQVTIISGDGSDNDGAKCMHSDCSSQKTYSYTVESDTKADSESAKYVISRDGIVVTVEGSDYTKVKDLIKEIEKTLDTK